MDCFDIFINVLSRLVSAGMICIYFLWGYILGDRKIAMTFTMTRRVSKFRSFLFVIIGGVVVHIYNIKMDCSGEESLIQLLVYFIPCLIGLLIGFRHIKDR